MWTRLKPLVVFATLLAALTGVAGSWREPWLRIYAAAWLALGVSMIAGLDPQRIRDRLRTPRGADEGRLAMIRALFLAHLLVGLIDVGRMHVTDGVPIPIRVAALVIVAAAVLWVRWAVQVNRFFTPEMRIQSERGHQVVTDGPYRFVRHPGYAAMAVLAPMNALALGSWAALAPALAYSFLILRRVGHEDRLLNEGLAGYASYASRVRYRLAPGIW